MVRLCSLRCRSSEQLCESAAAAITSTIFLTISTIVTLTSTMPHPDYCQEPSPSSWAALLRIQHQRRNAHIVVGLAATVTVHLQQRHEHPIVHVLLRPRCLNAAVTLSQTGFVHAAQDLELFVDKFPHVQVFPEEYSLPRVRMTTAFPPYFHCIDFGNQPKWLRG